MRGAAFGTVSGERRLLQAIARLRRRISKTTVEIEVGFAFKGVALLRRPASEDAFAAVETEVSWCEHLPFSGVGNPCSSLKGTLEPGRAFLRMAGKLKTSLRRLRPFGLHSAEGRLAASVFSGAFLRRCFR